MKLVAFIKKVRIRAYIFLFRAIPLKRNKIILWANSFKQYGCSPKYITEYLLKHHPNQFDIVWVFENGVSIPDGLPKGIKVVRYFSISYLREIHTAHFIICNMRTGDSYLWHKRKGQKYIQTWHSSLRLKKIEKDAEEYLPQTYIMDAKSDSDKIDLLVSGCEFSTKIFSNSFWYNGRILKSGTPRCDIFFNENEDVKIKVKNALGIDARCKIVLYAPTFRNDNIASLHNLDFKSIISAVKAKFGHEWTVVYRFHPNIINTYKFDSYGVDATKYSDMQELLVAADILVTDYSSCMFDMAIAGKPCFLYCPDIDNYMKSERGLYFNPHDLPFPLAKSNSEFVDIINTFSNKQYKSSIQDFMKLVGPYEKGDGSKQVADYIFKNLGE